MDLKMIGRPCLSSHLVFVFSFRDDYKLLINFIIFSVSVFLVFLLESILLNYFLKIIHFS